MRYRLMCVATAFVVAYCASTAGAQTLAYSFETGTDGFGPNGLPVPTVAQDTVGATHGMNSLRIDTATSATFVGALTGNVHPSIGDPPGAEYLLFDLTLPAEFTSGFAVIGVTIFGASQPDYPGGQLFGLQAQFADFEFIDGKAAGTYNDVRIDLTSAPHPLTGVPSTFNEIFGIVGSGPDDLIPTGVQFFINKAGTAPLTVYIDNVRVGVPEPATCSLFGLGAVVIGLIGRRRR